MRQRPTWVVVLAAFLLLLVPAQALACPIAIRSIGPLDLARTEVRRPVLKTVSRSAWGLDDTWASTSPWLSQFVRTKRFGTWVNVSYARQRAISIDARGPNDTGWMYFEDADPLTAPCQMVGMIEWQAPKIRVVQGLRVVRVAATAQRTVGDTTGCLLGPDHGVRACPNLTRTIVVLAKPLGNRVLQFETFP